MSRTAVVLFNLGGPDSREAIRPFLYNFFRDKNIIRLPYPLRIIFAAIISRRRAGREAGENYDRLGGKSPLLENTRAQARALAQELGENFKVFVCMRYWHPMADEVAQAVKAYAPDQLVLLPLYPQFSTTTTRSAWESWDKAARACGLEISSRQICCYPLGEGYISASAMRIRGVYDEMISQGHRPRVLFSAHGLPEDIIRDGDPYQWQCEQSAAAIAVATGIRELDWRICYQSRVGPKKWIAPSTEEALREAAANKVAVIIYPHAFVSEHVETLVEIEIEYRALAGALGVPAFARVPTVGTAPAFIGELAAMVHTAPAASAACPAGCKRLCPASFRRCPCGKG